MHPPAQATRDLAVALSSQLPSRHEIVAALLRMAEQDSRTEEETAVLTSELLATASAWGRSGFPEDALRLWEELLDVGCGIYYRKDYQFNEVLLPMKLAHEQDPGDR